MTEAAFSLNVKMVDRFGQEVMLTFRVPMVNQAEGLLKHYEKVVENLLAANWQVSKGTTRAAAPEASQGAPAANGTPICRVHGSPMKESRKPGSYFCSKKLANGEYCSEKA